MEYCLNVPLVTQFGIGAHAPDGASTPRGGHEVIGSVSIPTLKANEGLVDACKRSRMYRGRSQTANYREEETKKTESILNSGP